MTKGDEALVPAEPPSTPSGSHPLTPSLALSRALADLYARVPLGMRLGLEAMRAACTRAGNPELRVRRRARRRHERQGLDVRDDRVDGAGRGRRPGSTRRRTCCRFAERIRIDGEPISDEALADVLERALELGPELSFFEAATLAAFLGVPRGGRGRGDPGGRDRRTTRRHERRAEAEGRRPSRGSRSTTWTGLATRSRRSRARRPESRSRACPSSSDRSRRRCVPRRSTWRWRPARCRSCWATTRTPSRAESLPIGLRGAYQYDNARIAARVARELGLRTWRDGTASRGRRGPGASSTSRSRAARCAGPGCSTARTTRMARVRSCWRSRTRPRAGRWRPERWSSARSRTRPGKRCSTCWRRSRARASTSRLRAARPPLRRCWRGMLQDASSGRWRRACASRGPRPAVRRRLSWCVGSLYLVGEARALLLGLETDPPVAL